DICCCLVKPLNALSPLKGKYLIFEAGFLGILKYLIYGDISLYLTNRLLSTCRFVESPKYFNCFRSIICTADLNKLSSVRFSFIKPRSNFCSVSLKRKRVNL